MNKKNFNLLLIGIIVTSVMFSSCKKDDEDSSLNNLQTNETSGTFTDSRDGQTYKWVKIGNQVWMAENLNYDTGNGCWVFNNIIEHAATYGRLYDWETAKTACPAGWHLPTDAEWFDLFDYLGGDSIAGGILKEKGITHWAYPNSAAKDSVGFTALPGGLLSSYGYFCYLKVLAGFWSSTECGFSEAYSRYLSYDDDGVGRDGYGKSYGFSVRCLKD